MLDGTPKAPASHTADSGPDSRPKPAATAHTVVLEQLRDRIQAVVLDMSALSTRAATWTRTPRTPQKPLRPASRRAPATVHQAQTKRSMPKRRRMPQRRKRRSDKRPCSSTIEECSSFFCEQGDFTEEASAGATKNPHPPSSLVHFQTAIALHSNLNTFRSHDSTSHRAVHQKQATFHCSVTRSLRLKVGSSRWHGPC